MLQTQELKFQEKTQKQLLIQSSNKMITQEELKRQLHYDPETGIFTRLISNHHFVKVGEEAGCVDNGYIRIVFNGNQFYAHKLAWLYVYNELPKFPVSVIDHIDGNKENNKITNLRKVTHQENILNQKIRKNNTSGIKGVSWHCKRKSWVVRLMINGISKHLGCFKDLQLAELAAIEGRKKYHGKFARD
jgi:hypothetical protein